MSNVLKNWFVYDIWPIDFGWCLLPSVNQTRSIIQKTNAGEDDGFLPAGITLEQFDEDWRTAQIAAKACGWEGDYQPDAGPVVMCIPSEGGFACGFVFKQSNNGSTFVVSGFPLPHLQSISI